MYDMSRFGLNPGSPDANQLEQFLQGQGMPSMLGMLGGGRNVQRPRYRTVGIPQNNMSMLAPLGQLDKGQIMNFINNTINPTGGGGNGTLPGAGGGNGGGFTLPPGVGGGGFNFPPGISNGGFPGILGNLNIPGSIPPGVVLPGQTGLPGGGSYPPGYRR